MRRRSGPDEQFPTALVIARTEFLEKHPDVVLNFLRAHVDTTAWIAANPDQAKQLVNDGLSTLTGKSLKQTTIDDAWKLIAVTDDPAAAAVVTGAKNAYDLGFLNEEPDLNGLFALNLLNKVLAEKGLPDVKAD